MHKALKILIFAGSIFMGLAVFAANQLSGTYFWAPFEYGNLNSQTLTVNVANAADASFNTLNFKVRAPKSLIASYVTKLKSLNTTGATVQSVTYSEDTSKSFYDIGVYNITIELKGYSSQDVSLATAFVIKQWPLYNSGSKSTFTTAGLPQYVSMPYDISLSGVEVSGEIQQNISVVNEGSISSKQNPLPGKYLAGYYADWANYHYNDAQSTPSFNPADVLKTNLNTIYYAIGYADRSSNVSMVDPWVDATYIPGFAQIRANNPYFNAILSFGGWGGDTLQPSGEIEKILNSSANTDLFAKHAVEAIYLYGFNGVDLDWEWWGAVGTTGALNQTTAQNFINFFVDGNKYLNELSKVTGNPRSDYKLTMAGPADEEQVEALESFTGTANGWKTIADNSDLVNPMTYDYHGGFDTGYAADHQSRFDKSSIEGSNPDFCDTVAIQTYNDHGIPYDKMLIGLAAYGRDVTVDKANAATCNLGQTVTGTSSNEGLGGGVFSYKYILSLTGQVSNQYGCSYETGLANENIKYVSLVNALSIDSNIGAPWVYGENAGSPTFMSFDDHDSAAYKTKYAASLGMKGAFIWEIDQDLPPTDSAYSNLSIAEGAYSQLKGETVNWIPQVTETNTSKTGFTLTWNQASYQSDKINYVISGAGLDSFNNGSKTTLDFSGLEAGTSYPVTIKAVDVTQEDIALAQVVFTASTKEDPAAVKLTWEQNPTASNVTENSAYISWQASSNSTDSINYEYSVVDSSGNAVTSGEGENVQLTGLVDNSSYTVNVTATQASNSITASAEFTTTSSDTKPTGDTTWDASKVYNAGDVVTYNGEEYKAKWWNQGDEPDKGDPWEALDVTPGGEWNASQIYNTGDTVTYNGEKYTAKWWNQGSEPDSSSAWEALNVTPGGEWNASQVYNSGDTATYNGQEYKAKWWTQGDEPDNGGPWEAVSSNSSSTTEGYSL